MVGAFAHGVMSSSDRSFMVDPFTISCSSHCSMTGVTKAYSVCGVMHILKKKLAANWKKVAHVAAAGFLSQ